MAKADKEAKFYDQLEAWRVADEQVDHVAKPLIEAERVLRVELFGEAFPSPIEGSGNKKPLMEGWELQGEYKLTRKVDEAALGAVFAEMRKRGIIAEALIRWKPEVNIAVYRTLTEESRAVFDHVLEIKPQTPTLKLNAPAADHAAHPQPEAAAPVAAKKTRAKKK